MEFVKTSIEIYGVRIQEPVTALTDLLVSCVCFFAFRKLKPVNQSVVLLRYYFLVMAIATAYSGIIGHAFLHYLSIGWKIPGWLFSMFGITLLERTCITHAKSILSKNTGTFFTYLNSIELLILIIVVLATLNFTFVEAHAAYGLLIVVFSFEAILYKFSKAESSKLFLIAVGISSLAATTHLTQFSIHPWFNYLDLSHVLMASSAFVFFRGGQKLESSPTYSLNLIKKQTTCEKLIYHRI